MTKNFITFTTDKLNFNEITDLVYNDLLLNTQNIKYIKIHINFLKNKVSQLIESKSNEENIAMEVNNSIKDINNDLTEVVNQIDETLRSSTIDLELFNSIITYINNLNFFQTLAFTHICAVIFILLSLNSLIALYFGDYLINRFNIENKYPRIYKYIKLRKNFQVYFIIKDLIIIYITLIILAIINVILFITF